MQVDLSPADLKNAEALVAAGRFTSVQDAIGAGIRSLLVEAEDLRWSLELQECVDAGIEAGNQEDFANEAQIDELFTNYQQKSA